MQRVIFQRAMVAVGTIVALAACGGTSSGSSTPTPQADVGSGQLVGDGSSFDEPFFARTFYQYNQDHPQVSVNYGAHGSGAGISAFQAGAGGLRATDGPRAPAASPPARRGGAAGAAPAPC